MDFTSFGVVLNALGWLYWVLALAALGAALYWPKRTVLKATAALVVIAAFGYLPVSYLLRARAAEQQQQVAYAHFQMRCKDAGIRVTRSEEGIEGIYLMKLRPRFVNYDDQFTPDDVYGFDVGNTDYIKTFLRITEGADLKNQFGELPKHAKTGYRWVEAQEVNDGRLYRYTLAHKITQVKSDDEWAAAKRHRTDITRETYDVILERKPVTNAAARYGVNWADISTRNDREQWVAGGVVQVVDLETKQVIAERKGFMWDKAMGSRAGHRSPWGFARDTACPPFRQTEERRAYFDPLTSQFTQSVVKPLP